MIIRAALLATLLLSLGLPARAGEPPRVVASIAPLHSLVAAVMEGIGTPHLLVPRQSSPHDYTFKPSDAQALDGAAAVFWIGDSLETFLERPIAALAGGAVVVAAEEVEGITVLPTREGGAWEAHSHGDHDHGDHDHGDHDHGDKDHDAHEHGDKDHDDHDHAAKEHDEHEHGDKDRDDHDHAAKDHDAHEHGDKDHDDHDHAAKEHEHEHEHEHGHHGEDPHLWLSPDNAKALLKAIAATLGRIDPERAAAYEANAARAAAAVDAAAAETARVLAPVADRPYIVFHDAYQYFERHFGTHAVGSVSLSDARRPGARRVREIREKLVESGAACLFAEPQFDDRPVHTLVEGTDVRTGVLDPLGSHIDLGPGHYPALLRDLGKALAACLG